MACRLLVSLRTINPGYLHSQPSSTEGNGEQEHHCHSCVATVLRHAASGVLGNLGQPSCKEEREGLHDRSPVQCPPTTNAVKCENTNQCTEHISDRVESSDPLRVLVGNTSNPKNGRTEKRDTCYTDP